MLRFLSKRKRSRKILLLAFVILLAIGLVSFFGPGIKTGVSGTAGNDTVVAKVADYDITLKDLRDALQAFGRQMAMGQGSSRIDDPNTIYRLYGPQVLENLIREKLIQYEAEQRNIGATDREVQARLQQMFNPWPGPEQYRQRLQQAGVTPVKFENDLRAMIAQEKLRSFITSAIQIPPKEVEDEYRRNNTNYSVRWVEVTAEKFRDQVTVNDAALNEFFQQRKDDFRITTEQRRARYIFVDQKKAGEAIQVSDDELRQDFVPERNIQQVRVSQIVLSIPKEKPKADASKGKDAKKEAGKDAAKDAAASAAAVSSEDLEETVRKKAEELVKRAQGADGKPGEDFAALARDNSQDARSKAAGGDIGWVNKKEKRETDDPLNRVFNMQKDEVTQPTKKGDKFYILKVTDRKLPTFEESKEQLLKEARMRKGYTRAVEIATEAEQKFKETQNADNVVGELNKKYGGQVAAVRETPFFVEGDTLPDLGAASELESAIFDLDNTGEFTERLNLNEGFAVAQYTERREPHEPAFDEVKTKVEDRYRADRARELALERARQLCQAKTPEALKSAAESAKLKADERAGLTGGESIGPLITEADRAVVYKLNPNEVTREPIKVSDSDNYVVLGMMSRKDADMGEAFQKERKSIEERLQQGRRESFFSAQIAAIQKRLKSEGRITIYQDVIDSAMDVVSGAGVQQPPMPGGPGFPAGAGNPPRGRRGPRAPQPQ
jgi:peptidyl-prolyl cis-trans isomerase D